jgi:hypothetical protein
MPPPKKAVKKAAKKAAKKTAMHHTDKHRDAKDLRRAYEHMGRLEVLRRSPQKSVTDAVDVLINLAHKDIDTGEYKDAAELLRASEHLSFAALAGEKLGELRISTVLEQAIFEHFDELMRRAAQRWDDNDQHLEPLVVIYESSFDSASKAFKKNSYHQALEFARAAEALTHVKGDGPFNLQKSAKDLYAKSIGSSRRSRHLLHE